MSPPGMSGPRIRGHHLICLQFYHSQGFTSEFGHHLLRLIERMTGGEKGVLVVGHDDVCLACPALADGQCAQEPDDDHAISVLDTLACEMLELTPGEEFEWGVATLSVHRVMERWRALACDGCEWEEPCRPLIEQALGQPSSG